MKRLFLFAALVFGLTAQSHAEKADSTQPTNVEANQMTYDDVKQVNVFIGNVVMTRGTLLAKAEKAVLTQDPEGYQYLVMYAAPGKLASYRQKRDGGPNLWMEGYGERIEYDSKSEIAKFFTRARMKRLEGSRVTDEVNGQYISYDSKTEFFTVNNTSKGVSEPGAGRIKVTLQPKEKPLKPGKKGREAAAGTAGIVGNAGNAGTAGATGTVGTAGSSGTNGTTGASGLSGNTGAAGNTSNGNTGNSSDKGK